MGALDDLFKTGQSDGKTGGTPSVNVPSLGIDGQKAYGDGTRSAG